MSSIIVFPSSGINLKPGKEDSFLVVKLVEMPIITIERFSDELCGEQCKCNRSCSKHFTTYATLLDCLVNTLFDDVRIAGMFNGRALSIPTSTLHGHFYQHWPP
ncbi:hypothetical protein PTKIN_Ptkin11bG0113000 [Pterospermum kingtungense]